MAGGSGGSSAAEPLQLPPPTRNPAWVAGAAGEAVGEPYSANRYVWYMYVCMYVLWSYM